MAPATMEREALIAPVHFLPVEEEDDGEGSRSEDPIQQESAEMFGGCEVIKWCERQDDECSDADGDVGPVIQMLVEMSIYVLVSRHSVILPFPQD